MAKLKLKNVAKMAMRDGNPNPMDSGIIDVSGIIDDSGMVDESGLWEHDFTFIMEGEEKFEFGSYAIFDITVAWDSGDITQNVSVTKQEAEFNRMWVQYDAYTCPLSSISFEITNWVGCISFNYKLSYKITHLQTLETRNIEEFNNFTIPLKYLVGSGAPTQED